MRLVEMLSVMAAASAVEQRESDHSRTKRQQRLGPGRYRPRTSNYNNNYNTHSQRYNSQRLPTYGNNYGNNRYGNNYGNNNRGQNRFNQNRGHNRQYGQPQYPVNNNQYNQYPTYQHNQGRYRPEPNRPQQWNPQSVRRPSNPDIFKDGVPLAKPGHLARQAGRNVRPPGERDEREMNPRMRGFETTHRINNYEQSDYDEYEYSDIQYTYDDTEQSGATTMAIPTTMDTTTDLIEMVPANDTTFDDENNANFEYLNEQCGPNGTGTNHTECQLHRPWHPQDPDLDGLPDLITDASRVQQTVNLHFAFLTDLTCALEEGCLSASAYESVGGSGNKNLRKLLRFTQKISNIGEGDFISSISPENWKYHSCHKHYHSMNVFVKYSLLSVSQGDIVAASHKASFCLEDTECRSGTHQKYHCLKEQAISPGCSDIYVSGVDCQWLDVTDVTPGRYVLQVDINPTRSVIERNFKNNVLECDIFLTSRDARAKNCRNYT